MPGGRPGEPGRQREYRVEELAQRAGVSVQVVRSYQSKGLLPPPRHCGRVAIYGPAHLERLLTIRDLKARGHSLRAVASMLAQPVPSLAPVSDALLPHDERLTLTELAERTGVPAAMLRSFEASGLLRPVRVGNDALFTAADVRAVQLLLTLVGSGVPMEELMAVARVQLDAADVVATGAVELFMRYVREPLLSSGLPQKQEAERMVAGVRLLVQSVCGLVSYNLERTMLEAMQQAIEERGNRAERAALRREVARRADVA